MKAYKKLLIVEVIVLLVPVSLFAVIGGGFILVVQLFEKIRFNPLSAIAIIVFTTILLVSLISLWFILVRTIKNRDKTNDTRKSTLFFADVGAVFSIIILSSWIFINIFDVANPFVNTVAIYVFGSPALIPYLHLVYLNGGLLTCVGNKVHNTDSAKNAATVS